MYKHSTSLQVIHTFISLSSIITVHSHTRKTYTLSSSFSFRWHLATPITVMNRKSTKRRHAPPHIGTAMIIMMVLVTVGVAIRVSGTAAVVGVIEDAGKTPTCMSKMEYNCLTSFSDSGRRFWYISYIL